MATSPELLAARDLFDRGGPLQGDFPRWSGPNLGEHPQRSAYAELKRRANERLPETYCVVDSTDVDGAAEARFASLFFIPLDDGRADAWLAYGSVRRAPGSRTVIDSLSVGPYDDAYGRGGVTPAVWSGARPTRVRRAVRARLRETRDWVAFIDAAGFEQDDAQRQAGMQATAVVGPSRLAPRRGRRPLPDSEYFEFASHWLVAQSDPERQAGVHAVLVEQLGLKPKVIRNRLETAERREFLSAGRRHSRADRAPGRRFRPFLASLGEDDPLRALGGQALAATAVG